MGTQSAVISLPQESVSRRLLTPVPAVHLCGQPSCWAVSLGAGMVAGPIAAERLVFSPTREGYIRSAFFLTESERNFAHRFIIDARQGTVGLGCTSSLAQLAVCGICRKRKFRGPRATLSRNVSTRMFGCQTPGDLRTMSI